MDYAFRFHQAGPASRALRIGLVVVLHVALFWGLSNGMKRVALPAVARDLVVVFQLEQSPKTKPEPQKAKPAAAVKTTTPPVEAPPVVELPVERAAETVSTPALELPSIAPAQDTSPGVATSDGGGVAAACPNSQAIRTGMRYPMNARRDGLEGDVVARFIVGVDGRIRDIAIVSSTQRAFNSVVINAVGQFKCHGQAREVAVEVPFSFRLN
jgi:protein TonB